MPIVVVRDRHVRRTLPGWPVRQLQIAPALIHIEDPRAGGHVTSHSVPQHMIHAPDAARALDRLLGRRRRVLPDLHDTQPPELHASYAIVQGHRRGQWRSHVLDAEQLFRQLWYEYQVARHSISMVSAIHKTKSATGIGLSGSPGHDRHLTSAVQSPVSQERPPVAAPQKPECAPQHAGRDRPHGAPSQPPKLGGGFGAAHRVPAAWWRFVGSWQHLQQCL